MAQVYSSEKNNEGLAYCSVSLERTMSHRRERVPVRTYLILAFYKEF
jgi:hypothetical protein